MILRSQDGNLIRSVDDWFRFAPPKRGAEQWRDGRSAKELARAWFRCPEASPPAELNQVFASHPALSGLVIEEAVPECQLRLDDYKGERRNADLWLRCTHGRDTVIATVEAKADEAFGEVIGPYYDSRIRVRSNAPARIEALCGAVFGSRLTDAVRSLRYQLLHAVAATVISAGEHNATGAIFIVHGFESQNCRPDALARNRADWSAFVSMLIGREGGTGDSNHQGGDTPVSVVGPVYLPGGGYVRPGIPLFLGYCRTHLQDLP